MAQKHNDLRSALFESSGFLSDVLARCAFIEKEFYYSNESKAKGQMKDAIVGVYVAILHHAAKVQVFQQSNKAKQLMESVASREDHPLIQLVSAIKDEELHLHQWVQLNQHLQHKNDADKILARIHGLSLLVHGQFEKSNLSRLPVADGAPFDSYDEQHEEDCLTGTRTELLQQVLEWGSSPQGKCLFWLNGMAGTGKSTVSRTVARHFKEKGILGASFFFKRGEGDRGNAKRFFPTIAKSLSTAILQIAPGISAAITEDPDIREKSLREQFRRLILQRLCGLDESSRSQWVVVVDALDECDQMTDIKQLLQLLPELQKSSSVHLKVFLTSRPELPIQLDFKKLGKDILQNFILHEIPRSIIELDIRLFLEDKFSNIKEGYSDIEKLVAIAVPLFIFAATIYRFVKKRSPEKRLAAILKDPATTASDSSALDRTYKPILNQLLIGRNEKDAETMAQVSGNSRGHYPSCHSIIRKFSRRVSRHAER